MDVFEIRRFATKTGAVVNDFAVDFSRGVIYECHLASLSLPCRVNSGVVVLDSPSKPAFLYFTGLAVVLPSQTDYHENTTLC